MEGRLCAAERQQATDPRDMHLGDYVEEVMQLLDAWSHSPGRGAAGAGFPRRWAERHSNYEAIFAAMNPA